MKDTDTYNSSIAAAVWCSFHALFCPQNGVKVPQHIQSFITGATFSTLTNVNFDEARFVHMLQQATDYSAELKQKLAAAGGRAVLLHWVWCCCGMLLVVFTL